jgi:hypothetical protein
MDLIQGNIMLDNNLKIYEENSFGYYIANGIKYVSKIDAILSLPKNNYDIKWIFFDNQFEKFNWLKEPRESLDFLYKNRAQQLRDSYDHLVLCYSGGIDSQQVLESFVRNNIPLDEISFFGSFKNDEKLLDANSSQYIESKEKGLQNLEIQLVAVPYIKQLQKKWPNLKVDYYDHTDDFIDSYLSDKNHNWISLANNRFSPNRACKQLIHRTNRVGNGYDLKGKKTAYIWGFDKPRIVYKDDAWYLYFIDNILGRNTGQSDNTNDEYFYWSPNATKILAKQAHEIKRFIELDPVRNAWFKSLSLNNFPFSEYNDFVKPVIYPITYKPDLFTVKKASLLFSETYDWFYKEDNRSFQIYKDGINSIRQSISDDWFNNKQAEKGLLGSYSSFYQFA